MKLHGIDITIVKNKDKIQLSESFYETYKG